jgi:hypothetical protein
MARAANSRDIKLEGRLFPLHRGPFLFGPSFLSTSDWFLEFRSLMERILAQLNISGKIVQPSDGRLARIEIGAVEITIDGGGGIFTVNELGLWDSDEHDYSHWVGPFGTPEQFLVQLNDQTNIDLLGSDHRSVQDFSELLFKYMSLRFEKALQDGLGQLTARMDSPFSPTTALDFWQRRYLKLVEKDREKYLVEDMDLDAAIGHGGKKIYGLGVLPLNSNTAISAQEKFGKAASRGRKRTVDYAGLDEIMLNLLRQRGIPSPKKPNWTGDMLAKAVISELGKKAPSRATILNNLALVKERFKKEQSRKDLQQSSN